MKKSKKVIVLFLIENRLQFLNELPKILKHGDADGVILTTMFGSEILINGSYPNLLHLASLAKQRYPNKHIGIEIYEAKNITESEFVINWAVTNNVDHLWCKQGNAIVDKMQENNLIIYGADEKGVVQIDKFQILKDSMLEKQSLVICGGLTTDIVQNFVPYADTFVIRRPAITNEQNPFVYDPVKIKSFCEKVKNASSHTTSH